MKRRPLSKTKLLRREVRQTQAALARVQAESERQLTSAKREIADLRDTLDKVAGASFQYSDFEQAYVARIKICRRSLRDHRDGRDAIEHALCQLFHQIYKTDAAQFLPDYREVLEKLHRLREDTFHDILFPVLDEVQRTARSVPYLQPVSGETLYWLAKYFLSAFIKAAQQKPTPTLGPREG